MLPALTVRRVSEESQYARLVEGLASPEALVPKLMPSIFKMKAGSVE